MTAHVHDHPIQNTAHHPGKPTLEDAGQARPTRPRWLVPGLAAGFAAAALVVAGVVSLSTVVYFGFFGGMILMHVGGHGGHGGHGGQAGHGGQPAPGRGADPTQGTSALSHGSHPSQPGQSRSDEAPEDSASMKLDGNETQDHDQHNAHGCH